jgi:hypothetical protein
MHHDLGVRACWVFFIIVSAACKDLKSLLVLNVSCYSVEVMFNARRSEKNLLRQPTAIASSSPGANGRMSQTTR